MKKLLFVSLSVIAAATAAFADPISDRRALMKAHGKAMGTLAPMVKGEAPFDANVALAALEQLNKTAGQLDIAVLWPEGSGVGETKSSPKIWEDPAGFQAAVDKFKADASAAVAAAPQDVTALGEQLKALGANCGTCHQAFRL